MPQVLRPNDYSGNESKSSIDFAPLKLTKTVIYAAITGLIIGAWLTTTYLNDGLFFKEAAICGSIIFFLILIKAKSTAIEIRK